MNPSLTEIIPVDPKTEFLSQNDIPTVAEHFWPIAKGQVAQLNTNDNDTSYGELWKAYAKTTGSYPEM